MTRIRSNWYYSRRILRTVIDHPANHARPVRAAIRAVGWQIWKRVVRRPLIRPYEQFRVKCYPDSNSASNVFYFTSRYEFAEMSFLEMYLRPGDETLDVGANIGTYSLFLASRVGHSGHVDSIEPLEWAAQRAQENFDLNGLDNVHLHQVAISDRSGEAAFIDADVSSSLNLSFSSTDQAVTVRTTTLDDLTSDRPYVFGKLDVEGAELLALLGAAKMLSDATPAVWQIELLPNQLAKFSTSVEEVGALMASHGYVPAQFDPVRQELRYLQSGDEFPRNCLFVHRSKKALVEERLSFASPSMSGTRTPVTT